MTQLWDAPVLICVIFPHGKRDSGAGSLVLEILRDCESRKNWQSEITRHWGDLLLFCVITPSITRVFEQLLRWQKGPVILKIFTRMDIRIA
jgi:hypothetical protein